MASSNSTDTLLQAPSYVDQSAIGCCTLIDFVSSNQEYTTLDRTPSSYNPLRSFHLAKGEQKHYQQQYADMYFARLAVLKPAVEGVAQEAWDGFEVST